MEEIRHIEKGLKDLITYVENEYKNIDFDKYLNNQHFLSYLANDAKKSMNTILNDLKEIEKMILAVEDKKHIISIFNDIEITQRNKLIEISREINQSKYEKSTKDFFSNLVYFVNEITSNLETIFENFTTNYDIYVARKSKKDEKFKFWNEKLTIPIIILLVGTLSTWFINNKLNKIEENQKKQIEVNKVNEKFSISSNLSKIKLNTNEKIANLKLLIDNLQGALSIINKVKHYNYTQSQFNSLLLYMKNFKNISSLIKKNNKNLNSLYYESLKESEIFDIKYNADINIEIKEIYKHYIIMDKEIKLIFEPLVGKMLNDFIGFIKAGTILEFEPDILIDSMNKNVNKIEKALIRLKKDSNHLNNSINNVINKLG